MTKVPPVVAAGGRFAKDQFTIDLAAGRVTCPARLSVAIIPRVGGGGLARFGRACAVCPLASQCTTSRVGRTITSTPMRRCRPPARAWQRDPAWRADYRATRPKVERKLAHLLRRRGGRRARVRGLRRVGQDFRLLAAAANLARLAVLGVGWRSGGWAVTPASATGKDFEFSGEDLGVAARRSLASCPYDSDPGRSDQAASRCGASSPCRGDCRQVP